MNKEREKIKYEARKLIWGKTIKALQHAAVFEYYLVNRNH